MKKTSVLVGFGLLALGCFAFMNTLLAAIFNWPVGFLPFWPLLLGGIGVLLTALPFIYPQPRGLSALFIPGFVLLMAGSMLTWSSLFSWWSIWDHVWPLLVLAFAGGFLAAGVRMRNVWFAIPGILFGVVGSVLLFTAVTGMWDWWSVLWTAMPFAIGLALFVPGARRNVRGLRVAGLILMLLAAGAFGMMTMLLAGLPGIAGAGLLILAGLGLLSRAFLQGRLTGPAEKQGLPVADDIALAGNDVVIKEKYPDVA